jgi:hypothetical protein
LILEPIALHCTAYFLFGNGSRASGSLRHVGNGSEFTVPRGAIHGELAP